MARSIGFYSPCLGHGTKGFETEAWLPQVILGLVFDWSGIAQGIFVSLK